MLLIGKTQELINTNNTLKSRPIVETILIITLTRFLVCGFPFNISNCDKNQDGSIMKTYGKNKK